MTQQCRISLMQAFTKTPFNLEILGDKIQLRFSTHIRHICYSQHLEYSPYSQAFPKDSTAGKFGYVTTQCNHQWIGAFQISND